jgi:hypothetical protein
MKEYLSEQQRAQFERELAQDEGMLSEQQAQRAIGQGMEMAQADMQTQQQDGLPEKYGFGSIEEMAAQYERLQGTVSELRKMLSHLLDMEKAERTAAEMDVMHPEYEMHRQLSMELLPMREELKAAARNRMIQHEWQDSAHQMKDLEKLLPQIAEYIMRNPKYASEADGLQRAYDAVRSSRYRDEDELLNDPEFIGRILKNGQVREAVIRAHMEDIRRSGQLPQTVGAGNQSGKAPLSGRKPMNGMEQAKKRLAAMLGADMK